MSYRTALSPLGHTWIFDIDGTLVKHNGYLVDGKDTLLPGAAKFMASLPKTDLVILVTSRARHLSGETESFLREHGIRFDAVVYGAPFGERILVNDRKPSGLDCALAVNTDRDIFMQRSFFIDGNL